MKKRFNYANKKSNRLLAMKDNSKVKNVGVPEGIKIGHRHLKIKKNISAQGIKIESRSIHSTQAKRKGVDGNDFNKIKNIHVRKQIKNEVIVGNFDKIQRSTVDGDDIE